MAVNSLGTARYQHFHSLATDRFFLSYLESPLIFVAVSGQLLAKALDSLIVVLLATFYLPWCSRLTATPATLCPRSTRPTAPSDSSPRLSSWTGCAVNNHNMVTSRGLRWCAPLIFLSAQVYFEGLSTHFTLVVLFNGTLAH